MDIKIFLALLCIISTSSVYSMEKSSKSNKHSKFSQGLDGILHPLTTAALFGVGIYLDRRSNPYSTHVLIAANALNFLGNLNDIAQKDKAGKMSDLMFYSGPLSQAVVFPSSFFLFFKNKNGPTTSKALLYFLTTFTSANRVMTRFVA